MNISLSYVGGDAASSDNDLVWRILFYDYLTWRVLLDIDPVGAVLVNNNSIGRVLLDDDIVGNVIRGHGDGGGIRVTSGDSVTVP